MRKFLYLFLVMTLAGATACTEGIMGVSGDVEGTYQLTSINNRSLPFTLSDDGYEREVIRSGRLRLYAGGDFVEEIEVDVTEFGSTRRYTDRFTGYYEVSSRGEVMLEYDPDQYGSGDRIYGDFDGRGLVLYADGMTVVYRRS